MNATLTHERKRKEEEWDLVRTAWFIRKGFLKLKGILDNLRDALDKQYYCQLKHCFMAYCDIHTILDPQTPKQSLVPPRRPSKERTMQSIL